jgi:HD superfamily phosphodiesterase
MKLSKKHIVEIETFAFEFYKSSDYLHNVDHAQRTMKLAEYIRKKEGGNKTLVRLGALLHQFHDKENILKKFLQKISLEKDTTETFMSFAKFRAHRGIKAKSIEEKIVYDADALQVLGTYGTLRVVAERAERHHNLPRAIEETLVAQKKFFSSIQTKTARKMIAKKQQGALKFLSSFKDEFKGKYS